VAVVGEVIMFKKILEAIAKFFEGPTIQSSLEAHILAGNPQTPDDVDRLEREYMQNQRKLFDKYY